MLNGGAPETIPIKIRKATKIPAAAIMASLAYERTGQHNMLRNGERAYGYLKREQNYHYLQMTIKCRGKSN